MFDPAKLRNEYFAARHGRSVANESRLIISDPYVGIIDFGLTEDGKLRVRKEAESAARIGQLDKETIILCSDFLRTRQTAQIIKDVLGACDEVLVRQLRERFFGKLDGYHRVFTQRSGW